MTRRSFLVGAGSAVVVATASGIAVAQDEETGDGEEETTEDGETGDGEEGTTEDGETGDSEEETTENGDETAEDGDGGGGTEEVLVGPGGSFVFEPEELSIQPGTTVLFTWDSDNHNVNPSEQPDGADWEGYPELEDTGFEYEHTFDTEGEYHYICDPHISQGMEGSIVVDPDAAAEGEGGGPAELVPDAAWTLVVATTSGMIATISLAYAFLKYGGSSH